ncbi:Bacterial alpha-L-rhamnosidase [compost metagenome]
MNSFNHYSLGSVGEWMFRYMAGIEANPEQPGFQHVIISPKPGGNLSWVKASYESLYGCIKVEWQLSDEGSFRLQVDVPANTTATIRMPDQTATPQRIGSGSYVFESST